VRQTLLQEVITAQGREREPSFELPAWVEAQRAAGASWQEVAFRLRELTGRIVTPETIRLWVARWAADDETERDTPNREGSSA
jgi:hypothetical protein